MALDALEKDHLRQKMADRMRVYVENYPVVTCISGHYYEEPHLCDLCQRAHTNQLVVIKNRAEKKANVAVSCLKEMVRFQVVDVDDFPRWLDKISQLEKEHFRRKEAEAVERLEQRKKLEKKVIIRKKTQQL